jgi:hypothetical protein
LPHAWRAVLPLRWTEPVGTSSYQAPLRQCRCCAAPPTGPPRA